MAEDYFIRDFQKGDEESISKIFYGTVHHVNSKDYSLEQLAVWAPKSQGSKEWLKILAKGFVFVAIEKKRNKIVGFSDLRPDGCLEYGFVHKNYQRKGIGTLLLKIREKKAYELGLKSVYSNVSITACSFYLKHGYRLGEAKTVIKNGVKFTNYRAEKEINSAR